MGSAHGVISGTSGAVTKIAPPASVNHPGVLDSLTTTYAFDEQQGVTLASALAVDIVTPGHYDATTSLVNASIPIGTTIDSHFFASARLPQTTGQLIGTLTFPSDILGVIVRRGKMNTSNVLGAPGTSYTTSTINNDFELSSTQDAVTLVNARTITLRANSPNGADIDQLRIITAHDGSPVSIAGGPYSGSEGDTLTLGGIATDPENDFLTTSWAFSVAGDPGVNCTTANTTTLAPTIKCNDDAVVTAALSVSDPYHPPVVSNATVTFSNKQPALSPLTAPATLVPQGTPVNVSATFTDAGTNDTHTASVDWGDTTSSAASITETNGSGGLSGSHVYSARGHYKITVTLVDDNGGISTRDIEVDVNGAPTGDAGGPYSGTEGTATGLVGSAVDPDGDPLTTTWTFTPTGIDPGTQCSSTGAATLAPTVTCDDDAVVNAQLSVSDGTNPPVISATTVMVNNVAPVLGMVTGPTGPTATGANVNVSAPFSDVGTHDTHTATIDWGDLTSSSGSISELGGSGTVSGVHAYATAGIYTVTVTLTDDNGGVDTATIEVLINTPPTVDAGGPYVGFEGSQLSLQGTANDIDGDALTYAWTFTYTGDPGTQCTATGTNTLAPDFSCDDDAVITTTLKVSDGVNAAVTSTTTVTVGNVNPSFTTIVPSDPLIPTGSTFSVSAAFGDPGTNDTHTATINWGDTSSSAGTVTESNGVGTVTGSHVYAASGLYTVTVTVLDDNGGTATAVTSVLVNSAPVAVTAGGPYTGVEGAPLTLGGGATDSDGDTLTISWTRTIVTADPGTACSFTGTTTLSPVLTCDDDALVNVTITVSDGVNAPVSASAPVNVLNANPVVATPTLTPSSAPVSTPIVANASFTDPGTNDTHTATINWGDSTTTTGTVTESSGSGSVSGSHAYSSPGTYTVTVTVNDKDGGIASASAQVTVGAPPTGSAGGPYSGVEGSPVTLAGSVSNPNGGPVGTNWAITWTGDAGTVCSLAGSTSLTPDVTCNDDAVVTATLSVSDGVSPAHTSNAVVTIGNAAPAITAVTVPVSPAPINTAIALQASFNDAGQNDTHTASIAWGDASTSAGTVSEANGAGTVTGSHAYAAAGTYTVSVTVTDDDTGAVTATATSYVVVYDPSAGFVTGGGWISSPAGAYTPDNPNDPAYAGHANFGFVSKYPPGSTTPIGNTQFNLMSADLKFHATGMSWLVVTNSGTKAYFLGTGKVNNVSGYSFLVSVLDNGTSGSDTFRIKVWNTTTGAVVYDNQPGAADADSATQTISGGSIVVHA
jgi:PKD repeat protein